MLVLSGAGSVHYLVPGCDYIIGRKTDSDIVVVADIKYGVSRHVSTIIFIGLESCTNCMTMLLKKRTPIFLEYQKLGHRCYFPQIIFHVFFPYFCSQII